MKNGTFATVHSWKDFDFHKSFGTTGTNTNTLPQGLNLDAGLWMPNQDTGNGLIPPLPFGCTSYAGTDACMDEDKVLYSPMVLENIDHANANKGVGIKTMLQAAMQAFNRTAYYNVRAQYPLDWFDAIRVALASTETEKRVVIVGTPYYDEWAHTPTTGIMPEPADYAPQGFWHCANIVGWKIIGDQPYLMYKSWQGTGWGDNGWGYMSRVLVNNTMGVYGSVAYTLSKDAPTSTQTIDWNFVEWCASLFRYLLNE